MGVPDVAIPAYLAGIDYPRSASAKRPSRSEHQPTRFPIQKRWEFLILHRGVSHAKSTKSPDDPGRYRDRERAVIDARGDALPIARYQ